MLRAWRMSRSNLIRILIRFLKKYSLPIAIVVGIASYLLFHFLPFGPVAHQIARSVTSVLQPVLIFLILFITFCSVSPRDLKLCRWHFVLLAVQAVACSAFAILAMRSCGGSKLLYEAAMCCFVCPTATASGVVVRKLGGSVSGVSTYIILSNLLVSVLVPAYIPFINPVEGVNFFNAFITIILKLFPLLLGPLFAAWIVRYFIPKFYNRIMKVPDMAFYLWVVLLPIAIAVAVKSLFHSDVELWVVVLIAVVSLACCVLQFTLGWFIGRYTGDKVTVGQALGQKNTAFIIWMAYTFMTPVTAVVGGFYCIWHNSINSYQINKVNR